MSNSDMTPYFFALGANFAFAWATVAFAHFSKSISALWMNAFKAAAATTAFAIAYAVLGDWSLPTNTALTLFMLSGFLGLNIGDWFLLSAFKSLGASRTLMLYGFQPLMLGISGYFIFGQTIQAERMVAIIFLVACLVVFSLENLKTKGHWDVKGLVVGLIGISLDSVGVVLTRYGFDISPSTSIVASNLYRCVGAMIGFAILSQFKPIHLVSGFLKLHIKHKTLIVAASLSGAFLSLFLYLTALRTGHLATISAISITSPLYAGLVECVIEKKLPSWYRVVAFALFAIGFLILVL